MVSLYLLETIPISLSHHHKQATGDGEKSSQSSINSVRLINTCPTWLYLFTIRLISHRTVVYIRIWMCHVWNTEKLNHISISTGCTNYSIGLELGPITAADRFRKFLFFFYMWTPPLSLLTPVNWGFNIHIVLACKRVCGAVFPLGSSANPQSVQVLAYQLSFIAAAPLQDLIFSSLCVFLIPSSLRDARIYVNCKFLITTTIQIS